jgi:hypothetical protein
MTWSVLIAAAFGAVVAIMFLGRLRHRGLGRWFVPYVFQTRKRRHPRATEDVHLLLCIADHFEPGWGHAPATLAQERVDRWVEEYPRRFGAFRDSDGRPPRHTFFFPIEQYQPGLLDGLASLCNRGYGEVEVHLHHDNDTADRLRASLLEFKNLLARRHGLLARDRRTGAVEYGFIHGNWALDNARPDGRWCGVNNELDVLRATGCYADFTLPSAPSPTQTWTINSIYYAIGDPARPKSHDVGIRAGAAPAPPNGLLLIQGPLLLNWRHGKRRLLPCLENGCLQANQPPTPARLDLWLKARIQVPTRPDWFFVKLHTHGAKESNREMLLGEPMVQFHRALAERAAADSRFHFHYVTAREMVNLVKAAEAGWQGSAGDARDYVLDWPATKARLEQAIPESVYAGQ